MTLAAQVLTFWLSALSWGIYTLLLLGALYFAPYRALVADARRQHALYASCMILIFFWLLEIRISAGISIHPLLITATFLVFGWCLTILSASTALLCLSLLGQSEWSAFAINALLTFGIPATVSWWVFKMISKLTFKNLFFYLLGCGFAGAALAVLATAMIAAGIFALLDSPLLPNLDASSFPILFLILFPEAFINGTLVTTITVFFPDLVKTFNDHEYLDQ